MSTKVRRTFGAMLILAACLSAAYQATSTEVKADYEYTDENGGMHKIIGVANITPEKVVCWDTAGVVSETLTKKLDNMLRSRMVQDLQFRFGKKNRYLLVESDKSQTSGSWRTEGEDNLQSVYYTSAGSDKLGIYRLTRDMESDTVSISASFYSAKANKLEIPVATGKKSELNGYMLELSSATPVDAPVVARFNGQNFEGKCWRLIFKTDPIKPDDQVKPLTIYGFTANGADGKQIQYVDMKGNPVPPETYLKDPDQDSRYDNKGALIKPKPHLYTRAAASAGLTVAGALSVHTNIDPAKIKCLVYSWNTSTNVKFEPLPLDPKP